MTHRFNPAVEYDPDFPYAVMVQSPEGVYVAYADLERAQQSLAAERAAREEAEAKVLCAIAVGLYGDAAELMRRERDAARAEAEKAKAERNTWALYVGEAEATAARLREALTAIVRYFDRFPGLTEPYSIHAILADARRALEGGEGEKA